MDAQDPAVAVSHRVGSSHILSLVSSPEFAVFTPFGRLSPLTVHWRAMTIPAKVKQADIARALREAQKIGAKRVKIGPDGSIDILLNGDEMAAPLASDQQQPGPIRIRRHAKKRMDF
jgi:hypothetical protein